MTWSTRFANLLDAVAVRDLLIEFSREAQVGFRAPDHADLVRVQRACQSWIQDHYVRVATQDHRVVGILVAEKTQDFWDPQRRFLIERAWYMLPESRSHRVSVALWQSWQDDVTRYLGSGRIDAAFMSTQGTTGIDLSRRGWSLVENHWIRMR
jgi:hypothetical protein